MSEPVWPDEDLMTPEHLLHSRPVAADIAHRVLDAVIDDFRRPEKRAGLAAYFAVFVFLSRRGMKFLPAYFAAMGAMQGTERLYVKAQNLYGMAEDIHEKLTGQPELVFHGAGCPGHTTGMPAESCMAGSDATGKD